jgi:hypothetical protein
VLLLSLRFIEKMIDFLVNKFKILCFLLLIMPLSAISQTALLKGIVFDQEGQSVVGATVGYANKGVVTDRYGAYAIELPADQEVTVQFSYLSLKTLSFKLTLGPNEDYEFNPIMQADIEVFGELILDVSRRKRVEGIQSFSPDLVRKMVGGNAGVEAVLMSLPGVSGNNELSTQYAVRGGNYDENLVYVNEIEVYRPFLIRSGQQEGLSFVNSDLTSSVDFSAGGFQAKYGDKLSSVLDITYRRPTDFEASTNMSLLGGQVAIGNKSESGRFTALAGLRYRDNSLFVNAKETETNFRPRFADAQAYLTYKVSNKFELGFLGNASLNDYRYEPLTRQTNFGTLQDPRALLVFYEGQEKDRYSTLFGALKATHVVSQNYTAKYIASVYQTSEQEYFDILAQYRLGEVNNNIGDENLGEVEFSEGIGSQLTHARNDLDALIVNLEHKGALQRGTHHIDYGIKYTGEHIRDRVSEYEIIDSAGFSIRPPIIDYANNQPYQTYDSPIVPFNATQGQNDVRIDRASGYVQWSHRGQWQDGELYLNAGVRAHHWQVSDSGAVTVSQTVVSPRVQVSFKPDWKKDMLFRFSTGLYHQPPFYRELRNRMSAVVPEVKAQQSWHLVFGNDYSFQLWERPFTLNSEIYYKGLTNVNPYTLENVRLRYAAANNAVAYAYGVDMRLAGEFVPGTESWVSFGYLKTEENIDDRGYIFRPTDQRLKFGVLFQDYVQVIPDLKMYLNMVYNTGLPGGSPSYADPYNFQTRLPDYKRADLGMSYSLVHDNKPGNGWLSNFKELSVGVEIFNIFDVQNSITNTFVRDVYTKVQYAIPNYLTPRIFNIRVTTGF